MQYNCITTYKLPTKKDFLKWIYAIPVLPHNDIEITIRIVNIKEISILNFKYRKKKNPTNILSFSLHPSLKTNLPFFLGDIIICNKIILEEAKKQKKSIKAHWAHITIHGILHLLGYKHSSYKESIDMKNIEIQSMKILNYPDPYN